MSESRVKEKMEVIGADGVHVGTVDRVENGRIKLVKADSGEGSHMGHHHFIDMSSLLKLKGNEFACRQMPQSRSRWKKSSRRSLSN